MGLPVADDRRCSRRSASKDSSRAFRWITILRKREAFREAFRGFDFERVARMGERDVQKLLGNAGIVRHRGKIESTINNAKRARELAGEHGSLAAYFWRYEPGSRAGRSADDGRARAMPTSPSPWRSPRT
jgi:DNA-3-methyladenine glycosylase I